MLKSAGAEKDEFGNASVTATYSKFADSLVKQIEEGVGGAPADPELFTRTEKAELETMIVSQVALSVIGVEEVKVIMNAAGALSSVRGLVETMRHNENWESDPVFWGHLIGGVLSVAGLGSSMAKPKFIQLMLKYGWVAAAIPPLWDALKDYNKFLRGELPEKEFDARLKRHIAAACNVLKDAVLHVSQSQGGAGARRRGAVGDSELTGAKPSAGTAVDEVGPLPATKSAVTNDAGAATADPASALAARTEAAVELPTTKPAQPDVGLSTADIARRPASAPRRRRNGSSKKARAAGRKLSTRRSTRRRMPIPRMSSKCRA